MIVRLFRFQVLSRYALCARGYSAKVTIPVTTPTPAKAETSAAPLQEESTPSGSCCPANTILTGLNYLKDQDPVLALPDSEYPPWLWDLLKAKVYPDDGPGGIGEKMRLRKENRQRIREQNFLKTQKA